MKKYKVIKNICNLRVGDIIETDFNLENGVTCFSDCDFNDKTEIYKTLYLHGLDEEFFEEIKEETEEIKLPKFKVGDYVVYEPAICQADRYIKISDLFFSKTHKDFFITIDEERIPESKLRKPTEEELKLYFR